MTHSTQFDVARHRTRCAPQATNCNRIEPDVPHRDAAAFRALGLLVLAALSLAVPPLLAQESTTAEAPAAAWVSLFDGKTFAGWEGNLDFFRIEEQAIVAGNLQQPIPRNEFLCTERTYRDFELRLKVQIKGEGANAGIQFRTARIPDHHEVIGYQADVGQQWWGKLYDESRRRTVLAGPEPQVNMAELVRTNDWNEYVIRCEGNRIQLWLNGVQTVDYTETEEVADTGVIAVQIHSGPPSEAWYKDLQIREISR